MSVQYHPGRIESTFRTERQKLGDRAHVRSFDHDLLPSHTPAGEQVFKEINHNILRSQTAHGAVMDARKHTMGRGKRVRTELAHSTKQSSTAALIVAFGVGLLVSRILPSR